MIDLPGRRGWAYGETVITGSESRCAVAHVETRHTFWAWGVTHEERMQAAHETIDATYQQRWDLMADLIEEGDRRGPNVVSLDDLRYSPAS